ncbi:hypothetical protein ACJJTC_018081 [Scirpophaga incertulas]
MSRPTSQQLESLVEFLELNPGIAKGLLHTAHAKNDTRRKWDDISLNLNALGGAQKTGKTFRKGNASEAARLFRQQVQNGGGPQPETWPDHRMILRVHNSYMEGRLPGRRSGRPSEMSDPDTVQSVVEEVVRDPSVSVRTIERRIGIPKSQAHRILK